MASSSEPGAGSAPEPARARIICIEGPSAAGKTTLASALAREAGAAVLPEMDAGGAPPIPESARWFVDRHAALWQQAVALATDAPLVVLDGDPFMGLWYNPVFTDAGWPGARVVAPIYREHVMRGTLSFPDLYVVLVATEAQLRARRSADATRRRRNFEANLRLLDPQRGYFAAMADSEPRRVLMLETDDRERLVANVLDATGALPLGLPDSATLLVHMTRWLGAEEDA